MYDLFQILDIDILFSKTIKNLYLWNIHKKYIFVLNKSYDRRKKFLIYIYYFAQRNNIFLNENT